jgi:metal transporter CNNM
MSITLAIIFITLSAILSGLTIGMFTLDIGDLERKAKSGNLKAVKVLEIRKNGNYLLCTLLLGNSIVNSSIPIFLGKELGNGWLVVAITSITIFVFGELLPQAAFSRHALSMGSKTAWLVKVFMVIMWPIAKPFSILLDTIFGKDLTSFYNKVELQDFIEMHESEGEIIDADERRIMIGAMKFSEKSVKNVMTPKPVVYLIDSDWKLNKENTDELKSKAFSRIPVYENVVDNIIGVLHVKSLIGEDSNSDIRKLLYTNIIRVQEDLTLDHALNLMIKEKTHMCFVFDNFGTLLGIVTMEDIQEEILHLEIMDEHDKVPDMRKVAESIAPETIDNY